MSILNVALRPGADQHGFKAALRSLIAQGIPPNGVVWADDQNGSLFGAVIVDSAPPVLLPRAFIDLARLVICHRNPERYAQLYQLAWRMTRGEPALLTQHQEPLVHSLSIMARNVRRDLHKMHAFVRFRRLADDDSERFVAWFEPEHFIVEATAGFFVDRFRSLHWSIFTPVGSLLWDRNELVIGGPGNKALLPETDAFEEGWLTYYKSVFNPARVNPTAMRAEMAVKYWHNLPEAQLIPELVRGAKMRTAHMIGQPATAPNEKMSRRVPRGVRGFSPATGQ